MTTCLSCLRPVPRAAGEAYHPACLERLFGRPEVPEIELDPTRLHEFAVEMLRGHRSLSGVQQKVSLGLTRRGFTLRVGVEGRSFVIKPQSSTFPQLPENELVTMRIAAQAGVEIPPSALVRLRDGSLAYLTLRFDRTPDGHKVRQEDFCQLSVRPPKHKYRGSTEQCAQVVRRYCTDPGVDIGHLFARFAVSWWVGNGDLHLKNLSLVMDRDGVRLSPAYDLLSTRLVIPGDGLALPIGGKRDNLTPRRWSDLAGQFGLPPKAAARIVTRIVEAQPAARALVEASPLSEHAKRDYLKLLALRTRHFEQVLERLARPD